MRKELEQLAAASNKYGSDALFVLAGGGNTSFKTRATMWIKPSGTQLATIRAAQFLPMARAQVSAVLDTPMPANAVAREARIAELLNHAVLPGSSGRPSVEACVHNLFDAAYVVHLHPGLVNGMTCGRDGAAACARLFSDALWIPYTDPGFTLARRIREELAAYKAAHGAQPAMVFLQNHGVFVGADALATIDHVYATIMQRLRAAYKKAGVATTLQVGTLNEATVYDAAPRLRGLLGGTARVMVTVAPPFAVARGPLTPDHIVYAKSYAYSGSITAEKIDAFAVARGYRPVIVAQKGAVFAAGTSVRNARIALALARDAALVQQLAAAFGGARFLDARARTFIETWEVESYRQKVSLASSAGRLQGKVAVVTGAAQGFGRGIAECLAAAGALVVVADMNAAGAEECAAALRATHGADAAMALPVNVTDEASVARMLRQVVAVCGGVDLLVANAGVLRAGSVKTMPLEDFAFVTQVNYTGYFVCVKHVSRLMARQNASGRGAWTDIVQVNSKSGLQGSNKNSAYAGSKFGAIGLTQSFAKELLEDRIKVNAVCPGNYFEGPLWSDPERGLFRQYLDAGKVPGAATIADVRRHYEAQVPMGRGCTPADVARAIVYCVEQDYETGQAVAVSGGQVMLK
jgi:NAD(P)-dependent dehydrogenase (short-subunit alcohol dehydrogenase family)/rhamnose utilization protein RhaD (predicted bifunctional aldolase and dehydrogenase)